MPRTGTHVIADLGANAADTVMQVGEERVAEAVQRQLDAHNRLTSDMLDNLALTTTERLLATGAGDSGAFEEADELARVRTQKGGERQTLGIPLRRFMRAVGWTREYLEVATLQDIQKQLDGIQQRDLMNIANQVKRALFTPTNYTFFDEYASPQVELAVKALYNADGALITTGPNGDEFDGGTHTHYLAAAALADELIDNAIRTVAEHGHTQGLEILINEANLSAFAALDGFLPAVGPLVQAGIAADSARLTAEPGVVDNTAVGVWDGRYVVRTKTWIPAGYFSVVATGAAEDRRPLAFRQPAIPARQGLRMVGQIDLYPLRADHFRRYFGVSAYNRDAAAVAQFTSATYAAPSF